MPPRHRPDPVPYMTLDSAQVRANFERVKELSPKVATDLRRDLRQAGDEILKEQRKILAGPKPPGIVKSGSKSEVRFSSKGQAYRRKVNTYEDAIVENTRSTQLRAGISASLKNQVTFGKTRNGIRITTVNAKKTGATFYQSKIFRHPVFNTGEWAYQRGLPYFWGPAYAGAERMQARIQAAFTRAFNALPSDK